MQTSPTAAVAPMTLDLSRIAQDLQIRKTQVESVVHLLDEGNTVPFITRYRKERTGGLNEEFIRRIQTRVQAMRQLLDRKQTILKSLEAQGKLTDELREAIVRAETSKRLEDLYLPYKPKKRTSASEARDKGLEPLAMAIWTNDPIAANLAEMLPSMINPEKGLNSTDDILQGVRLILAEVISEIADVRGAVRRCLWDTATIVSTKHGSVQEGQGQEFKSYFDFKESAKRIPPHRILALNRGENEKLLQVKLEWDSEPVRRVALDKLALDAHPHREFLLPIVDDALERLILPSLEREIRRELTEEAQEHAVNIFARNLRSLLLQPPLRGKGVLAIDPALRTGCKVVALDAKGVPLEHAVIYPYAGRKESNKREARNKLEELIRKYQLSVIAIGNGPACRETERLVADLIADLAKRRAEGTADGPIGGVQPTPPIQSGPPTPPPEAAPIDTTTATPEPAAVTPEPTAAATTVTPEPTAAATIEQATTTPEQTIAPTDQLEPGLHSAQPQSTDELPPPQVAELPATAETTVAAPTTTEPPPVESVTTELPPQPAATTDVTPADIPADTPPQATTYATDATLAPTTDATDATLAPTTDAAPVTAASAPVESAQAGQPTPEAVVASTSSPPAEPVRYPPAPEDLAYIIVNEAGASHYSTSAVAREEFPEYDSSLRGTISIGRRLQDPLSEMVKIEPQHVGVGLYQHDLKDKNLKESLDAVVESCVNHVGVDLNTASVSLLRHVSGLNQLIAREIVEYRKNHGPFRSRQELLNVPNLGEKRYEQAAGFLKIYDGDNPLDLTWVHPESYHIATQILNEIGLTPQDLLDVTKRAQLKEKLQPLEAESLAERFNVGVPTIRDILDALARPGYDPREELPPPIFKKDVMKFEDLQPGMELKGTVLNVVDFGAFVDIGLKESGLVHISQMADRFIKNPYDVTAVGNVITVWVLKVEPDRGRVSLTMIPPGTERKSEPRPAHDASQRPPRQDRRPPRQDRRPGPSQGSRHPQTSESGGEPHSEPQAATHGDSRSAPRGDACGERRSDSQSEPRRGEPRRERSPQPDRNTAMRSRFGSRPGTPSGNRDDRSTREQAEQQPAAAPEPSTAKPPSPSKSGKPRELPKLSQAKIEGRESLQTFSELAAFFKGRKGDSSTSDDSESSETDESQ